MQSFEELGLSGKILSAIKALGFETPTPIQAKVIPHLLSSDYDLIATAQTGTGKTAAFGLPVIALTDTDAQHPQTLILSPTRELCLQITSDLQKYAANHKGLGIVPVYGGSSIEVQIRALRRSAQIVVATPGRAKDLIRRKKLKLSEVERVVLDEADEMLTMGFKDDLEAILNETPPDRQILLFSATMSPKIKDITQQYMYEPVEIAAERVNTAAKNVRHVFYKVHSKDRYEVLKRIADMNPNIYGITFCRTRRETKEVANKLLADGYNADALHGDLSQAQRDEVMGRFRARQLQMLVATDVASRGLDVNELTHVVNYNLPDDPEVYIHRSGRTGRAGRHGVSIAIINTREQNKIRSIERISGLKFNQERVPTGKEVCTKQLYALIDKIEQTEVNEQQIAPFLPEIYDKLSDLSREQLIKHFVSAEFNRFLAYYKNARDINLPDKRQKERIRDERQRQSSGRFTRMYINVGAKHNLTPHRLIGIINEGLDSSAAAIGKIEILRNFSFFGIDPYYSQAVIQALKGKQVSGVHLEVEKAQEKEAVRTPYYEDRSFKKKKKKPSKKYKAKKR